MYAFVHIEKTAGTTLNGVLRRWFGTRHCDIRLPLAKRRDDRDDHRVCVDAADLRRVRRLYRNLRGIAGHNVKAYADLGVECPEIRYFTFLRDPVARFRSHFLYRAPHPTHEACQQRLATDWVHNWQTKMIAGEPNADKAIELISRSFGFVGFTERFDESLLILRRWLRAPSLSAGYRFLNRSVERKSVRNAVRQCTDLSFLESTDIRNQIRAANVEDQKVYDFVASNIYPAQRAAYLGNLDQDLKELQTLNQTANAMDEPTTSRLVRNYIYKPLLHCHLI